MSPSRGVMMNLPSVHKKGAHLPWRRCALFLVTESYIDLMCCFHWDACPVQDCPAGGQPSAVWGEPTTDETMCSVQNSSKVRLTGSSYLRSQCPYTWIWHQTHIYLCIGSNEFEFIFYFLLKILISFFHICLV